MGIKQKMEKIGKEIRRVRQCMNLSQKAFGELIGKSESQVGAYENVTTSISMESIFKIAEVAGIRPEELIYGPQEQKVGAGWDAELRIYNVEDRKTVMTILAVNGYDVGQHKRQATPTGKTLNYYVHATDLKENADTSR